MMNNNKYTAKQLIVFALTVSVLFLNFLTLMFTVVRGGSDFLSGAERFFANGMTLAFEGYPIQVEGCGNWLRFSCAFHFAASLLLIFAFAVYIILLRSRPIGKLGLVLAIICVVMSLVYMINGCVAYSTASEYANLYFNVSTASFVPFIMITLIFSALVAVKIKMPDDFKFE